VGEGKALGGGSGTRERDERGVRVGPISSEWRGGNGR